MKSSDPKAAAHPADAFVCDLCGNEFDSVSELEDHKRDEHRFPSHIRPTENWDEQRDIGEAGLPGAPQV